MKRVRSLWRRFIEPAPGQTARKPVRRTVRQSYPSFSFSTGQPNTVPQIFSGQIGQVGGATLTNAGWNYISASMGGAGGGMAVYVNGKPARWNGTHWVI